MTLMLVVVRTAAEATVAVAGGADRLVLRQPEDLATANRIGVARGGCPVALWVDDPGSAWRPLRAACGADVVIGPASLLIGHDPVPAGVAVWLVAREGDAEEATGIAGLVFGWRAGPRPPFEASSLATLEAAVAKARTRSLRTIIGGSLEAPDVPRLLALAPDALLFDGLVRGDGPAAALDPARLRLARDLMTGGPALFPGPLEALGLDRIQVRDWTVAMPVGAYSHEQAPQRVSFTVEAELAPTCGRVADMRDVVSYDLIIDSIGRATATRVALVETLAEDLARAVLGHPRVLAVDITVEKLDLGPGRAGCRLRRRRAG